MPDDDNTPRARWRLFGGGERVSANKALLLLNPATWSVDLGTFSDRPEPDGGLWDLDHAARLDPADYRWYSYAGLPAELYLDWSYGSPARPRPIPGGRMSTPPTLDAQIDAKLGDIDAVDRLLERGGPAKRLRVYRDHRAELVAELDALEARRDGPPPTPYLTLYSDAAVVATGEEVSACVRVRLAGRLYTVAVSRHGLAVQQNDPEYGNVETEARLPLDGLAALARGGFPFYPREDTE